MSDRDRLVELLKNSPYLDVCYGDDRTYEKAAYHLLSNGAIVPPCKVGEKVYSYLRSYCEEDGIAPYQITNITITQNKKGEWTKKYRAMWVVDGKTKDWQLNFSFDDIGKTVFLTREEAERALEDVKGV